MSKVRDFFLRCLKKPIFYFCVIFLIANLFFTRQILNANGLDNFAVVAVIELAIEGAMIALLILAKKKKWAPECKFLILAIGFGILFIGLLPPGQSPDELNHFRRAYGVTEGVIIVEDVVDEYGAVGSDIPVETYTLSGYPAAGTYEQVSKWLTLNSSGEKTKQSYTNTALYNFVCYIPQILAAFLGKVFGMSVIGMAYLMEIFNFAVWVLLVYFAIKMIPKFKTIVLFIALLPITLQEATSLAPDALAIGLGIFLVSYVLYLAYGREKHILKKREIAILYVMALLIGFCKIVYFPLVLLYLIIPTERFGSKKRRWMHLSVIAGLTLLVNLSWLMIASRSLIEFTPGVNSKEQVAGIIKNPLKYAMVMFRTLSVSGYDWLRNMLGVVLGAFAFDLPSIIFAVSLLFLTVLVAQRDERLKMRRFDRLIVSIVLIVIIMLIFASLYVQWTAVGAEKIEGIQGRYFLPILLLVPVVLNRSNDKQPHMKLITQDATLYYSLFVNVIALITIFARNF